MRIIVLLALATIFIITSSMFLSSPTVSLVHAQSSSAIQSQETDFPGVVAEIIQCRRKRGILTVQVRARNTSSKRVRVFWHDVKKDVYLMDETNQKKYFVLKDATGDYIWSGSPGDINPDTTKISWFKFPAPPADVKEITVVLPKCAPFEDVPIQDK